MKRPIAKVRPRGNGFGVYAGGVLIDFGRTEKAALRKAARFNQEQTALSELAARIRQIAKDEGLPAYLRTIAISEDLAYRFLAGERGGFLGTLDEDGPAACEGRGR